MGNEGCGMGECGKGGKELVRVSMWKGGEGVCESGQELKGVE